MNIKSLFKYTDKIFIFLIAILLVISVYNLCFPRHVSKSYYESTFEISQPYEQICKTLVLNDCSKYIVEKQHGSLITSKWNRFNFGLRNSRGTLLSRVSAKCSGNFSVYINNDIIGKKLFFFDRQISIDKNFVIIDIELQESGESLRKYISRIILIRGFSTTEVKTSVYIEYSKIIPITHKRYMNKQVDDEAIKILSSLQSGLIEFLQNNKDSLFTIESKIK